MSSLDKLETLVQNSSAKTKTAKRYADWRDRPKSQRYLKKMASLDVRIAQEEQREREIQQKEIEDKKETQEFTPSVTKNYRLGDLRITNGDFGVKTTASQSLRDYGVSQINLARVAEILIQRKSASINEIAEITGLQEPYIFYKLMSIRKIVEYSTTHQLVYPKFSHEGPYTKQYLLKPHTR